MADWNVENLAARLAKLERENLRIKRLAAAAFLLTAAMLAMAFQSREKDKSKAPKTLEVSKLLLKSPDGKGRGWLVVRKDSIGIAFGDGDGPRSGLVFNADGAALKYFDREGNVVAGVGVQQNGVTTAAKTGADAVSSGLNALVNGTGNALNADAVLNPPAQKP